MPLSPPQTGTHPPAESLPASSSSSSSSLTMPSADSVPEIEAVSNEGDDDNNYWSDGESGLTSLTSSITNYVYENGRTYHSFKEGKYVLPNDDQEKERLDLLHHIFTLVLRGQYHLAPLSNPQTILDLGTGTGIWALDVADMYPSAKVIGNDLSPIQPEFTAPNTEFVIEDLEEEWEYNLNYFDFIHGRMLSGSVQDWPQLFKKCYKHMKPGGWLEMHESPAWCWSDDGSLKKDSPLIQYLTILEHTSSKSGRSLNICEQIKPWMIQAGFEDVHVAVHKIPWGPWPKDPYLKELGRYQFVNAIQSVEPYGLALLTRRMGYTEEHAKIFLAVVKDQIRTKALHAYSLMYFVYGRKPL